MTKNSTDFDVAMHPWPADASLLSATEKLIFALLSSKRGSYVEASELELLTVGIFEYELDSARAVRAAILSLNDKLASLKHRQIVIRADGAAFKLD